MEAVLPLAAPRLLPEITTRSLSSASTTAATSTAGRNGAGDDASVLPLMPLLLRVNGRRRRTTRLLRTTGDPVTLVLRRTARRLRRIVALARDRRVCNFYFNT